ncbi:MAG TPA: hypothetical protein VEC19_14890 [Usitatibacter sp.]|nr:hypothetical protein [Usitatibacter sp.]
MGERGDCDEDDASAVERDGVTSAQVRTLTEIGMIAAGRGMPVEALAIFEALQQLRPQRAFPYIGLALTHMNAGRPEEAVRVIERDGLAACPGDTDLRAFLGLALKLAQRPAESVRVLEELLREHPGADSARFARSLLAER